MHYFHSFVIFILFVITFPLASFAQESTPSLAARPPQIVESDLVQVGCAYSRDFLNMPMWIQWGIDDVSEHTTEILADQSWYLYTDIFLDDLEPGTRYVYQCVGETDLGDMYNSEILDVVTDPYPATLFNVSYAFHTIHNGDVVWHDDWDLERLSSGTNDYWYYNFYWERAVDNHQALVLLIKGTFGNLEGEVPEEDVNYKAQAQAWWKGGVSFGKAMGRIGQLYRESAWTGTYTVLVAEVPGTYNINGVMEWFASGGESGIEPRDHAMLTFEYKGVRPETTPPTFSYATSTVYGGDGIYPDKGVADEDELTFAVVYTDAENDAPEYVRTWVRDAEGLDTFLDMIPASESGAGADAPATLTDGNYQNGEFFTAASTFPKGVYTYTFLTKEDTASTEEQSFPAQFPEDSGLSFQTGYSSVAFLPGVMASRIYVGDNRTWEPSSDSDADAMMLNTDGTSENPHVYVKEGDVIDEELGFAGNIYLSWLEDLEEWKEGGFIADYAPLAYDWRLNLDAILSGGKKEGGRIYFDPSYATDTPYIYEELKRLADSSDSGKVTIVAHSMGGLLLKKALYDLEHDENHPYRFLLADNRIEDVILVASPQWGTPEAIPALLHGERLAKGIGIYDFLSQEKGRELARTMYTAHALVPSEAYMEHVTDVDEQGNVTGETKVVRFNQSLEDIHDPYIVYDTIVDFFGDAITTYDNLLAFLGGDEGRPMPEIDDVVHPIKLFDSMTSYGEMLHGEIDDWSAPDMDADGNPDIRVVQIAGWGIPDTIKGYEYYTKYTPIVNCQTMGAACAAEDYKKTFAYKPIFTYDGDKTVVLPSAVAMDTETYHVNLDEHNKGLKRNREHSSILEPSPVRNVIHNIIQGIPDVISGLQHIGTDTDEFEWNKDGSYIRLAMHSPVNVHVYDSEGNHVGVTEEGNIDELIPNSYYTTFGESTYLGVPGGEEYTIVLEGTDDGVFTFEMTEEGQGNTTETTFSDVFIEEGAVAEMVMQHVSEMTQLTFDTDNDGEADAIVLDDATEETTTYDTLRKRIEESTLSKAQKRLFRKQIDTIEKLHVRGNVIAAKTLLIVLQKQIERLDCENARSRWKKKICISSDDILPINTVIIVLLEKLENPVNERKEDIKDSGRKLRDKLKDLFNR